MEVFTTLLILIYSVTCLWCGLILDEASESEYMKMSTGLLFVFGVFGICTFVYRIGGL